MFRAESRASSDGAVLTSLHENLNCHIDIYISFTSSQGRDNPFTFMNVAFLVLGYMLALVTIFSFTFVRVFQLATM